MKRITVIIALFTFCNSIICAQDIMVGDPYYFCALNGSCYNDVPNRLVTRVDVDFSPEYASFLTQQFLLMHSGCTIIEPSSKLYNCHGYAYSVYQSEIPLQIGWKENLCSYNGTSVESYIQIEESQIQKGDIATIIENNVYPLQSRHSAIVWNNDTMISKLNDEPLFKHHKYESWFAEMMGLGVSSHYVYYRRIINTPDQISGPYTFNGTGVFDFYPSISPASCSWSVEPADMFQVSSGTGYRAILNYRTPFVYLAPKATITFTFSYGCDNHYTVSKEFDLRIPTTTISGNAISEGFIIDGNATVTVTGNIKSNKNAKTIVPVGTRLILDGGMMTSNEDGMWQGIEVWGNSSTHQYEINGNYAQGYLELKNGAVIENAKCAVELWRPEHWSTTGGIIHATDATFRNNTTAVHAHCYSNYNPNTHKETSYNAYFNNCTFVVDENYSGTETFTRHVTLADVNGITFRGCDFSAKRGLQNVHQWCVGINAYNAGFTVNSLCNSTTVLPCPDDYLDKSTFTGFCAAIRASSNGSHPRSFSVRNSVFTNNDRGIHAENTGFPTILLNEFNIGQESYCQFNYGIFLNHVTGFSIEQNDFRPVANTGGSTIGIAIYDSRGINDIYHNHFERLSCGNIARGQNTPSTSLSSSADFSTGLTYSCNTNENNHNDFRVFQKDGIGNIQSQQGSTAYPAGNTFDARGYQFDNQGSHTIDYYYNVNEPTEVPSSSLLNNVTATGTTNVNHCIPHYGNGSVVKSIAEKTLLESDYLSAYTTFTNLKQLYENRIDGGNTEAQISDITNATSADMWQLRAQLLGISPYVSGQVLTTAAERNDIFTDPVLFEILSANPDELKNDSLISYLENKTNPLPNYMIDLLRQIATGITARTAMVAQLGKYGHDYSLAAGDMVRSNLNDSISNPSELRQWLGNMNDIAADRMAVSSYLNEGDSVSAFALANMIPQLYGLQGNDLTDHHDYMRLINLYQTLKSTHRTVYEMTETETATVDSIAELGTGISKSMAQSLLEQVLDTIIETCPDHIPDLEEGDRGRGSYDIHSVNKAIGFTTNIGPNPATTWTTVEFTLPSETSTALLTLTNTLGINVLSTELNGKQGSKVLDLRGLATGIYIYTIRYEQHIETGKLVITK